jgi:hypothetical protein
MEFNKFDVLEAYMLIAIEWGEYALFDRITRKIQFHAPMLSYEHMSDNAREIYHALTDKYQTRYYKKFHYIVVYNNPGYLPDDNGEECESLQAAWDYIENTADLYEEQITYRNSMLAKCDNGYVYEIFPVYPLLG